MKASVVYGNLHFVPQRCVDVAARQTKEKEDATKEKRGKRRERNKKREKRERSRQKGEVGDKRKEEGKRKSKDKTQKGKDSEKRRDRDRKRDLWNGNYKEVDRRTTNRKEIVRDVWGESIFNNS